MSPYKNFLPQIYNNQVKPFYELLFSYLKYISTMGNCQLMNIYRTFPSFSCKINSEEFHGQRVWFCMSPSCIFPKSEEMLNWNHNTAWVQSEFGLYTIKKGLIEVWRYVLMSSCFYEIFYNFFLWIIKVYIFF